MRTKQVQKVFATLETRDGRKWSNDIEGTNTGNLTSRITGWVRSMLIQHGVADGAVITVRIDKAEVDEYANPER